MQDHNVRGRGRADESQTHRDEHVFSQNTLFSRRTSVYTAVLRRSKNRTEVVAKFSYQRSSRWKEQVFVNQACEAGVEHVPRVEMSADLFKMTDGIRKAFLDSSGNAIPYDCRTLRAIVYPRYRPLKELLTDHCLFIPVMVDQMIDCACYSFEEDITLTSSSMQV